MTKIVTAYKLARPDGWDFYTGNSINYRGEGQFPHVVKAPDPNAILGVCSSGVIHASAKPNDCFVGAKIPCSAYRVQGVPVAGDVEKWGFLELKVMEEITDLDGLLGWRYTEAINPLNPLALPLTTPTESDIQLLWTWASLSDSVWDSVWDSIGDSIGDSVWNSIWALVGDSIRTSVWNSIWASVGDSVRDLVRDSIGASVGAYVGYIIAPFVTKWQYVEHDPDVYPFQSSVDLWKRGFVPSYDGKKWRLHSGRKSKIVWEHKEVNDE